MSLINEALKRTRDAAAGAAPAAVVVAPSYRIDHGRRIRPPNVSVTTVVVGAVILGGFGLGSFLAWRTNRLPSGTATAPATAATPAIAGPVAAAPAPARMTEQPATPSAPAAAAGQVRADEEVLVSKLLERIKAEQVAEPAKAPLPDPPKLVLQGITRGGQASEAMINGYTVRVGDEVDGARVEAIEPQWVKLRFGDRGIVLRLR